MAGELRIKAQPYDLPYDGCLVPERTALIIIDMQRDFCHPGGYVASMGYDVTPVLKIVPNVMDLLERMRSWGGLVVHTREGHRPDLSDVSPHKMWRSKNGGARIGAAGPLGRLLVRGEPGWEIISELEPKEREIVIDKIGYSAFWGTDLEAILRQRSINKLVLAGVTTDVCVHSTLRDAVDRGYECLLVSDACASTKMENHRAALDTITTEGGIFGAVADVANCEFTIRS